MGPPAVRPPADQPPAVRFPQGCRPPASCRRVLIVAALLALLAAATRLGTLNEKSLWGDEIWEAKLRVLPPGEMIEALRTFTEHPPLLLLLHSIGARPGRAAWTYRLPDALWGVALVPLLYLLLRRRLGEATAVLAAFLVALSPFHLRHSQDCTGYAALPVLTLLSFATYLRAWERRGRKDLVLHGAVQAAFFLSHYFAFVVAGAQVVLTLGVEGIHAWRRRAAARSGSIPDEPPRQPPRPRFWPRHLLVLGLAGIPFLAWIPFLLDQPRSFMPQEGLLSPWALLGMTARVLPETAWDWARAALRLGPPLPRLTPTYESLFLAAGVVLAILRGPALLRGAAAAWFFLHLLLRWMFWIHRLGVVERYMLFLYPLSAVLAASAAAGLRARLAGPRSSRPRAVLAWGVVLAAFAAVEAPSLRQYFRIEKAPWRAAVSRLREGMRPGDVVLAGAGWSLPEFLAFHLEGDWTLDPRFPNNDFRPASPDTRVFDAKRLLERVLDDPDPPDLTRMRIWTLTTPGPMAIFRHLPTAKLRAIPGVRVWSYPGFERTLDVALHPKPPGTPRALVRFVVRFLAAQSLRGTYHKPMFHDFPLQDLETILVEHCGDDGEIVGEIVARYRRLGWNAPAEDLLRRRDEARRAAGDDSPSPRGRG